MAQLDLRVQVDLLGLAPLDRADRRVRQEVELPVPAARAVLQASPVRQDLQGPAQQDQVVQVVQVVHKVGLESPVRVVQLEVGPQDLVDHKGLLELLVQAVRLDRVLQDLQVHLGLRVLLV